jgi:hypothetical protein
MKITNRFNMRNYPPRLGKPTTNTPRRPGRVNESASHHPSSPTPTPGNERPNKKSCAEAHEKHGNGNGGRAFHATQSPMQI